MKTRKILSMMMATVLCVSALTGCGGGTTGSDKDEQGRTVISVGNWPTKEGDYLTNITIQKDEFERDNSTMAITPDTWTFDLQTFYSKAAANQLPTLYYSNPTETALISSGGYYTDLTEGLKRAGYEGKFNESVLKTVTRDGKIVSFPTSAYSLGLVFNVELFEAAGLMNDDGTPKQPKDWDEVVEFGKKIKEATGKAGFIIPTMNNCGGWLFTPIAWSYGVEFMKAEGDSYTATFDSAEMVNALQYISDLKWKHGIFIDNALVDLDEYYKQFALGNVGMILGASNVTDSLYKYEMPIEKIGMMPIPAGPERHVTLMGGYQATVKNGSSEDQVDVAIKWLEKTGKGIIEVTDEMRESAERTYQKNVEDGKLIGLETLNVFSNETPSAKLTQEMIQKYKNINLNHVRLYNESLTDTSIELQAEEPKCAQELYAKIDAIIQEILTNENADIKSLVEKANKEFQSDYLN